MERCPNLGAVAQKQPTGGPRLPALQRLTPTVTTRSPAPLSPLPASAICACLHALPSAWGAAVAWKAGGLVYLPSCVSLGWLSFTLETQGKRGWGLPCSPGEAGSRSSRQPFPEHKGLSEGPKAKWTLPPYSSPWLPLRGWVQFLCVSRNQMWAKKRRKDLEGGSHRPHEG